MQGINQNYIHKYLFFKIKEILISLTDKSVR